MPTCSIIIPVFNRASITRQCLNLLLAPGGLPGGAEIIVVDDGSGDVTPRVLAAYGDRLRAITHPANTGFATACNDGAAVASGEALVFLNNDTIPRPGWLDALLRYVKARPGVGAAGARLLFPNETIQHAGIVFGADGLPLHLYAGFPAEHPAVMKSRRFRAVTGACLLVRRGLFEDLDGFDPAFRNAYEDVDLCLRLGERGHEVHYCHESVLVHLFALSRDRRHLDGGPLRDIEQTRKEFQARWSSRIEPDEVKYYVEDGLLTFGSAPPYPRRLSVSPLLAAVDSDGGEPLAAERLVSERSRQVFGLMREKVELEAKVRDLELSMLMGGVNGDRAISGPPVGFEVRRFLAGLFLQGAGLELGALHAPLPVDPPASVRYVDRIPVADLRRHYPELDGLPMVEPDVIDDGERLASIGDASQDFLIANHFLEHCQDPIGAIKTMLRVLKVGGVAYLAVPDKRFTFDRRRPVTPLDHLLRDHDEGPAWSREAHFEEWVALAEDENIRGRSAAELMAIDYSIHFHVWTQDDLLELLAAVKSRFALPFEVEAMVRNGIEVIFILRKLPAPAETRDG